MARTTTTQTQPRRESSKSTTSSDGNTTRRRFRSGSKRRTRRESTVTEESLASSELTFLAPSVQDEILLAINDKNTTTLQRLLGKFPHAATTVTYPYQNKENAHETLLSLALLHEAPLEIVQAIYNAAPKALTMGNAHGMSALHQAATVSTSLDVWLFLETQLNEQHSISTVSQLAAPGNWTVLHIACRCGCLPIDTFEHLVRHAKTSLAQPTKDKISTPLHLAIFGLSHRSSADQRFMLQHLIHFYPYAVNLRNAAGNTPVELAQHQKLRKPLPRDMVHLLLDVQALVRRKFGTRTHVEQAIQQCEAQIQGTTASSSSSTAGSKESNERGSGAFASNSSSGSHGSGNHHPKLHHRRSSTDEKAVLQQGLLAHIEMQMLLPLRKKLLSEAELVERIQTKMQERQRLLQLGPTHFTQAMAMQDELILLEKQLKREREALIPDEIQATRNALYERLQAPTTTRTQRLLPINNISLRFLEECTDHFSAKNRIGKGGFGSVYRAYDAIKCTQYAVKKTDKFDDHSLLREVEVRALLILGCFVLTIGLLTSSFVSRV